MKTHRYFQSLLFCFFFQVSILLIFNSCAEVPVTHRKGLHLVPESELVSMGFQQYRDVIGKAKLSTDTAKVQMIRRVGERVAKAAEEFLADEGRSNQIKNYQWEFNLIEDDQTANAWVMPGGKAAVYTGILKYAQNETGLAVVLGHEVSHAIAGHGNERMSQALLANIGATAISVALAQQPQQTREIYMMVYGVGTNVGVLLPYSRLHENEADHIGLILMARAGYDPQEAVPFWERMNKAEGRRSLEFLSTHPAPETRIERIKAEILEALPYYLKSKK
ncbi:MAG TPA: M48 family metallopeptidase [Deltaproteobacteria bacterium]|nr:M48 family metallopeptidase [Deltaproteobacteria bacterium]